MADKVDSNINGNNYVRKVDKGIPCVFGYPDILAAPVILPLGDWSNSFPHL